MKSLVKEHEKVVKQLNSKKARLQKIINSQDPKNLALYDAHIGRQIDASHFLSELEEVSAFFDNKMDVRLVSVSTLNKQVVKADFATIEFDGEYCKLALVQNFPYNDLWLLYVAPVESI